MKTLGFAWVLGAALLAACGGGGEPPGDRAPTDMTEMEESLGRIHPDDPDARSWLRENGREDALASNRFADRAEALAFVDELYAAGAVRVVVASEAINDDEYELSLGGPYADALKVELPSDEAQRRALFGIARREVSSGYEADRDEGQAVLVFWWD